MTQEEITLLEQQVNKIEAKMNALVDPLIKRMEQAETITPEMQKQLEEAKGKYDALQKHLDELDIKLQKANVPDENAPLEKQIQHVIEKADWLKSFKESKKGGGVIDLKGIDIHQKSTVTRVTDTIPMQWTGFQYAPGRRFHVRDIIPTGTTTTSQIWMPYESATSNGIARVAEGALKPESYPTPSVVKWAVEKIATWIKFSEEIMEDMPLFTSYLTTRWIELLKQAEDTKLLYGTGSSDIKGLTVSGAAYVDVLADSKVDRYMILDAAVTQVRKADYTPNYILLHPTDALLMRQTRDTTGAPYVWYASQQQGMTMVAGVPVIETAAMTVGDFLVGDFSMGAQIFDRKAANIKFYDQNEDDAKYNLILAVIEERLALVTFDANAFCFSSFGSALARGSA